MKTLSYDIDYLCSKMSDMSGLPIRIYRNGILDQIYTTAPFVEDPLKLHFAELRKYTDHVSYHISEDNDYYGIINADSFRIIIGPGRSTPLNKQELYDLAFRLAVKKKDTEAFFSSMRSIMPMPLDSILQMMCSLNHIINGEKLNVSDFQVEENKIADKINYEMPASSADTHKSYNIERHVLALVESGDTEGLTEWVRNVPTVRSGSLSSDLLRQTKNTFIVTATLACRSAIRAGMNVEDAFRLSDTYIRKCENTNDLERLSGLQYEMIYTCTDEVRKLKKFSGTRLKNDVYQYIIHHLSDPIRTKEIAAALYLSRSHLSTSFREECGIPLKDYIHEVKIETAKQLMKDPSADIALIADYLGYSSASHFSRIFKRYTGHNPKQYRKAGDV